MSELVAYFGTMNSGKSQLALQMNFSRTSAGQWGILFTKNSREEGYISSRLGIKAEAFEVSDKADLYNFVFWRQYKNLDFIIADEAQFYSPEQIDQLAWIVDNLGVDVFAFGLLTDFRSELFPGSKRLVELADRVERVQATAVCWCGSEATLQARVVGGVMTKEGPQVMVGDTLDSSSDVSYATICRDHWTMGVVDIQDEED